MNTIIPRSFLDRDEPTAAELAAIERESDVLAAELALLDAEIAEINAGPYASPLETRRIRRAEARLLAARREFAAETETHEVA